MPAALRRAVEARLDGRHDLTGRLVRKRSLLEPEGGARRLVGCVDLASTRATALAVALVVARWCGT